MSNQLDKATEALRALIEAATPFGYRDDDPISVAKAKARAVLAELTAPIVSRWCCPACKSDNVHISLPTWYRESITHDLEFIDTDAEADISWWYCYECGETDSGQPDEVSEKPPAQPTGDYTNSIDVDPPCDSDEDQSS